MYYVGFSSATIAASLILFQGFNTTDATNTISLIAGFVVTFLGVHLLNLSRAPDPPGPASGHGHSRSHSALDVGLMNPRISVGGRSVDGPWSPSLPLYSAGHGRRSSLYRQQDDALHTSFGDDSAVGLELLREEDEDEEDDERSRLNSSDRRDRSSPMSGGNTRLPNGSGR